MEGQSRQTDLKIIIGILISALLALTAIFYFNNRDVKQRLDVLADEREIIIRELKEVRNNFGLLSIENEQYSQEIQRSQERIQKLLDSIDVLKTETDKTFSYQEKAVALERENKRLRRLVDSIKKTNTKFKSELGTAKMVIKDFEIQKKEQEEAEKRRAEQLKKEAFGISSLIGNAYRIRQNGNLVETVKAEKIQRLRTCFVIEPRTIVKAGEKDFYLKFINPEGNTIVDVSRMLNANDFSYSKKATVLYKNETIEVCDFISIAENQLKPGKYQIKIIYNKQEIASSTFRLK